MIIKTRRNMNPKTMYQLSIEAQRCCSGSAFDPMKPLPVEPMAIESDDGSSN